MNAVAADRGRAFDAWADDYDRYRPGYPDALFGLIAARLALPDRPVVADLGAGTGLASTAMAARGWQVMAVEPGEPMLDVLRARSAEARLAITTVQASAEATGLVSASVDLATAAQAFHWFDHARALSEMGRIVRPGGGIALFWNIRDANASSFMRAYLDLLDDHGTDASTRGPGRHPDTRVWLRQSGAFEAATFLQVRHSVSMSPEEFIGLAFTASYVRALAPERLAAFRADLGELATRHAVETGALEIPYVVDCEIARRKDR